MFDWVALSAAHTLASRLHMRDAKEVGEEDGVIDPSLTWRPVYPTKVPVRMRGHLDTVRRLRSERSGELDVLGHVIRILGEIILKQPSEFFRLRIVSISIRPGRARI